MMKTAIDLDAILAPIAGDNPAGENLRWVVFDDIEDARRADDNLERGDWERPVKKADWEKVMSLCADALASKTKDLQIAAWLTESLTISDGFDGFLTGLKIISVYLTNFWEHVYPEIDDGDLEYRMGRLEFLNNALWSRIKEIPFTDPTVTEGYSWLKWQESRQVGYETDPKKKKVRAEQVADGKITAEDFDNAKARSSKAFYQALAERVTQCRENFRAFEESVDQRFGKETPRLAELRTALEDCEKLAVTILEEKRKEEPDPEPRDTREGDTNADEDTASGENQTSQDANPTGSGIEPKTNVIESALPIPPVSGPPSGETVLWESALGVLRTSGIQPALSPLLDASSRAPSVREKNRYRLLMAKLCLQAQRPELARPIVEELNTLIEELNLERWESPQWIAEVLDALYQCLTAGEPSSEDSARSQVIFQKMCTLDATKAMIYKH